MPERARAASLRAPAVLRAPVRVLRLRHRRRPRGPARRLRRRAACGARARTRSLAPELETIFLGGGTPTLTSLPELVRLLEALPAAEEVTSRRTRDGHAGARAALRAAGVNRVSLGAQTFRPELLRVLERPAGPDDVRRAVHHLRDAGFDNISLDLIYGIPVRAPPISQPTSTTRSRSSRSTSPVTSSRRSRGRASPMPGVTELERQAEALEDYFERVVARLTGAGYRWYETANFCRAYASGRTCARGTTLATGSATTTSGSGSARSRQSRTALRNTPASGATSPHSPRPRAGAGGRGARRRRSRASA